MGYYSYRLGVQSMAEVSGDNGYNHLLSLLKATLDPHGILAPGRYQPVQPPVPLSPEAESLSRLAEFSTRR
jgi:4-cresol dehydrogenase (hydroxylating)